MKFKLKNHLEERPAFYHNVDKYGRQVTVCVLKIKLIDMPGYIPDIGAFCSRLHNKWKILGKYKGFEPIAVTAKVTCLEGDTYNKELGEKMALAKARYKAYIAVRDTIGEILGEMLLETNKMLGECNMKLYKMHISEINYFNLLKNKSDESVDR